MRVMLYTCISLVAAVLTDLTVLFLCIRSRILVSDYGLNDMNIHVRKEFFPFLKNGPRFL